MNKIINVTEKNFLDCDDKIEKLNEYLIENNKIPSKLTMYQLFSYFDIYNNIYILSKDFKEFICFLIFDDVYDDKYIITFSQYTDIHEFDKFLMLLIKMNFDLSRLTYINDIDFVQNPKLLENPFFIIDKKFYILKDK